MINNSLIFLSLGFILFFNLNSFSQEFEWHNWEDGYKKAINENKIILLDAYTEWCGWCKVMDRETYTVKNIQNKIANDFIAIKLNPELAGTYIFDKISYSGKDLIQKLSNNKFRGFPTTFFVFPKTSKSYMEVGYIKAEPFDRILDKYVNIR
ncbi:MAG: DUF255 domain-containing protein [Bacteroidales bacterium]|nr:DUF255 domain-containing protein [Bacteroidales bacterium]MBN2757258.1 DUF255 domain-containing protein [Bacteroidales bacterium]